MAQQVSQVVEAATAPFHYALKTEVGCECIAHIIHDVLDMDDTATVVSIDVIGAFDLTSRNAVLEGLFAM